MYDESAPASVLRRAWPAGQTRTTLILLDWRNGITIMVMYGWNNLKKIIAISPTMVEWPVLDCRALVERQRKTFRMEARFTCPAHRICISPSTFEYLDEQDNMLWTSEADLRLWACIKAKGVKRESRMARDNSEDAVTWNVFRYLEANGLIGKFINSLAAKQISQNPRVVYWSFCQASQKPLPALIAAASTFGEDAHRRSEPDVILDDDNVLIFVESKVLAGNRTKASNPENPKLYQTGGNSWFRTIFHRNATFTKIAVEERLYELMRFWLLGSWIAAQAGKKFLLVNVVRDGAKSERTIEARFNAITQNDPERAFVRCTWERIYSEFVEPQAGSPNADRVGQYMRQKTLGYSSVSKGMQGKLRQAFNPAGSANGDQQ